MDNYLQTEKVYWKFFGLKLLAYRRLGDGQIVGTGLFNPIANRFRLLMMLILQARFYKQYEDLGTWNGKRVANSFAPPVGSRPQFRALKGLIKTHLNGKAYPVAMTFAVTYRCQCKCPHCSAGNHLRTDIEELSSKEAKKLIDDSQDLGVTIIAFTGGEPLLRKDIFEIISYVNQQKAMPILFTNGSLLTDENVEKLANAGLYSLFVSLDSPDPWEHDSSRGMPGLFETAVEGMMKMKRKGVFVGISSYASRTGTSKGLYKKMHQLAIKLGVHNLLLFDCVPTGKMLKDTSEMLTPEQREEIYEYSDRVFKERIMPPISSQSWQNSIEAYLAGIGCLAGNIQYYVSAHGDVAPCDFAPLSFGNIREESLKSIWKKIVYHPAYNHRAQFCRMQHNRFRQIYIDPIPESATLPYPIEKLSKTDYLKTYHN